jgi:hypothetical protein
MLKASWAVRPHHGGKREPFGDVKIKCRLQNQVLVKITAWVGMRWPLRPVELRGKPRDEQVFGMIAAICGWIYQFNQQHY